MYEADFYAVAAFCVFGFLALLGLESFETLEETAHPTLAVVSSLTFIAVTLGLAVFCKFKIDRPVFSSSISMGCIILFAVLLKEGP